MTKRIVLFLLFFASMAIHAQEYQTLASQREAEADEYATKSYKRKDAYGAYLSAYRLYNLAGSQCNGKKYSILAKARNLLNEEKYMMEQSAVFVDSLISESFDEYKDSLDTFLPLLETYILKKKGVLTDTRGHLNCSKLLPASEKDTICRKEKNMKIFLDGIQAIWHITKKFLMKTSWLFMQNCGVYIEKTVVILTL